MIIRIKATPNAKQNEIIDWITVPHVGPVLRVRIQSPPVDGKANKALCQFLAKSLGLSKSQVSLVKGATSRIKSFEVPDDVNLENLSLKS